MSDKTDAEQIRQLAENIIQAENLKQQFVDQGGVILINDNALFPLIPTNAQKQSVLSAEAGWWASIKSLAATH